MTRESRPRQRTIREMQRLLAMATGAALGACAKGQNGSSNNPALLDANAAAPNQTRPEATGYAVVDPMPPPARCRGLAETVEAETRWEKSQLVIELSAPGLPGATYDASKTVEVHGGAIPENHTVTAKTVALRLALPADAKSIELTVPMLCSEGPGRLRVMIRPPLGSSLKPGGKVFAELRDLW